jgi:hypothetical protein
MPHIPSSNHSASQQHDVAAVAQIVALIHARRKGDYLAATRAHNQLVRLGVLVRFPRRQKGVDNG